MSLETRINPSIDTLTQELFRATKIAYILELIDRGANIHAVNESGRNMLNHFLFLWSEHFLEIFSETKFSDDEIYQNINYDSSNFVPNENFQINLDFLKNYIKLKNM